MADSAEKSSSGPEGTKTVTLSERDLRDAARLFRLLADPTLLATNLPDIFPAPATPGDKDRDALISRARGVLSFRKLRERYFGRDMFGEPAWDILLILYVSDQTVGRLSVTKLAELTETPLSTVVRWVNSLEAQGLVERQAHPTDRRTIFIKLLGKGRDSLDSYLSLLTS